MIQHILKKFIGLLKNKSEDLSNVHFSFHLKLIQI